MVNVNEDDVNFSIGAVEKIRNLEAIAKIRKEINKKDCASTFIKKAALADGSFTHAIFSLEIGVKANGDGPFCNRVRTAV